MTDGSFVTIYVLCYGEHTDLHERVLTSLADALPERQASVVVWGNELCDKSVQLIEKIGSRLDDFHCHLHDGNAPKYTAMRRMWHHDTATEPRTPWVLWLDDDTYISQPDDWWQKTLEFIKAKEREDICYIGKPYYVHHLPGQEQFIRESTWYNGRDWEMLPTKNRRIKKPGVTFATGSYVWLRTDVMQRLSWPDIRLAHNGGDTLLGEAIRQQGLPFHKFHYGVTVNAAKRRGRSDRPAGSRANVRR